MKYELLEGILKFWVKRFYHVRIVFDKEEVRIVILNGYIDTKDLLDFIEAFKNKVSIGPIELLWNKVLSITIGERNEG